MDCDLQDEPESIPRMLELAREGHDVVYSVRSSRGDGRMMRFATSVFYRMLRRISDVPHPDQAGPFSVLSRRVVDEILALPERNMYLPGMRAFVGFDQVEIPMHRPGRHSGKARFTPRAKLRYGLNALFAFSNAPLRLASWIGIFVATGAGILALVFVYFKLFTNASPPGFTGLITVILFLGGVQLITLGVIGEYVGRVYDEVKRRPRYLVSEVVDSASEPEREAEIVAAADDS
jgi:dolichol-phosphate mannosyltransferase